VQSASGSPSSSSGYPVDVGLGFRDCEGCPEMIVLPAGSFMMGSPEGEKGRLAHEGPQRVVTIRQPLAVGRFEVTFAKWSACARDQGCSHDADDRGWGRDLRPVINVNWNDAQRYARWLSKRSGKTYRLLTESEWEYAARSGTTTPFWWGDEVGLNNANCDGCGSPWDDKQTAPVGSFKANRFGLHDLHGNAPEWVEDCYRDSYAGAPADATAVTADGCQIRVARGGAWFGFPPVIRAAARNSYAAENRYFSIGFRLARAPD
jgi:formylglycine-generating enzyme required for sulfatase activity